MSSKRRSRTALIRASGPYHAQSFSQVSGGVRIILWPAYPYYGHDWPETREAGQGGGPGMFTAVALASEIEAFLNAPYSQDVIEMWKTRRSPSVMS